MAQFLGESVLIALVALVLALALVEVLLPVYGSFLQVPLTLNYLSDWPMMLGFAGIAILAGLLGGFYPALVISGFRPAAVLRANTIAAIPVRAPCAPPWWCCNSRSRSVWASPPRWCSGRSISRGTWIWAFAATIS